jgi:hypothetical protein
VYRSAAADAKPSRRERRAGASSGTSPPHAAKQKVQEGKTLAEHKQTESGGH